MGSTSSDDRVDVVVIGSGFGGSVAAHRLAEAGLEVCILERGRAYPPGSFPRDPAGVARNFWDPSKGHHGMFNVWSFSGIDAVVSSGLGGGSLIYANVLLRKDERWFVDEQPFGGGYERWPIGRADLEPHYDRVEPMLQAQHYPYPDTTPKTVAMRHAADVLGHEWQLPPLAVTFANPGRTAAPGEPIVDRPYPNLHGLPRRTCILCGECDIGCNEGAKETLDHNYLSAAAAAGADIRIRHEVRALTKVGDEWEVDYIVHEADDGEAIDTARLPVRSIRARRVVVAAGALGSTFLLLRNRAGLPWLSPTIGTRFSGNGDLLGFLLRARNGDGSARALDGTRGPVITSAIRFPDGLDTDGPGDDATRGFYVEDAGYPAFLAWLAETTQFHRGIGRQARVAWRRVWARLRRDHRSNWSADLAEAIGSGELSASSLPLLGMGRDVPDGTLRLEGRWLANDWSMDSSKEYFDAVRAAMEAMAAALGGEMAPNPLAFLKRVVTVHPLGGAPMAATPELGVVDPHGAVFGCEGLHVLDGAVMPGPTGPNPALTIAAFADRGAEHILELEGLTT